MECIINSINLILASSSPYRRSLLEKLGLDFRCESPEIDESRLENEAADSLVARLAVEKARVVAENRTNGLVIGSDQVAECDAMILGKPGNAENARKQLLQMRGKTVNFHTGLCVYNAADGEYEQDVVLFKVSFRDLTEDEIERYLAKEQPFNCAGSFKSEGLGITLFNRMEGDDPNALIGLPLIRLCEMLRKQGLFLP